MSAQSMIRAGRTVHRRRVALSLPVICILFSGAAAAAADPQADEPSDARNLRQTVKDLRKEVAALRREVRKLAAASRSESISVDDGSGIDASSPVAGGTRVSLPHGPGGTAPSSSSTPSTRPAVPRYRRYPYEHRPYYGYPQYYSSPYYYSPYYYSPYYFSPYYYNAPFVYPYEYHLYNYGIPINPNAVIVNPYEGLWFSP